ncbi:MAG TPA: hypothetical protein PK054_07415 [Anaerohalosphaeraceae bacterium]|nr:hypothetical protein [Anaerohalosphaeraceae bacterium]HOL88551.1 hypothetical protein [Anaerohalosphaeraceae bacterium]HPP56395.1 hypothetical protein [Anaerohalosphaeraceae bacterium]
MDEACRSCGLRRDCQSVYEALGKAKGPSVVWKSIFIFLAPLAVFAVSATGLDVWMKGRIENPSFRTAAVFLLSAVLAVLTAAAIRLAVPSWRKRSSGCGKEQNDFCSEKDI